LKVDFSEGINFLSGDIGSGKSSILHAIEFVLFGFKKGDLEGSQLLRKGEDKANVKLVLEFYDNDNNLYKNIEIFRKIKKQKLSNSISQENGYIKFDDNLLELSPTEINAKVFEIFSFPNEFLSKDKNLIYRFSVYSGQEQLKEVLFADSEKKQEIIRKIFNIDKYKKIKDAIVIYSSKLREYKKINEIEISNLEDNLKNKKEIELEYNNLTGEMGKVKILFEKVNFKKNDLNKIKEKRDVSFDKLKDNIYKLNSALSALNEILNYNKDLKIDLEKKRKEFEKLDLKLKDSNKKDDINKKIKEIEKEILNLNKIKQEFIEKIILLDLKEKELKLLEEKLNEISKLEVSNSFDLVLTQCRVVDTEKEINNIKLKLLKKDKLILRKDKLTRIIEDILIKLQVIENKIDDRNKLKNNLSKLDVCPTCFQNVDDNYSKKIVFNLNNEILNLKKDLNNLNNNQEENKKELEKLNYDLIEFENYDKELLVKKNSHKSLKEKLINEKKQEESLNLKKKNLYKLKKEELLDKKKILFDEINDLKEIKNKYDDIQKKEIDFSKKLSFLEKEKQEFDNIKLRLNELEKVILDIEKKIKLNDKKLEKKEIYNQKLKENNDKLKLVENNINKLKLDLNLVLDEEKELISKKSKIETNILNLNKQLEDFSKLEIKKKQLENKKIELLKLEDFILNKLILALNNMEKGVFTKYYVEFNEEFEKLFLELIDDNNIEVKLSDDFDVMVEQNGYDIDIKNLSGGEKSSIALSYRLALKKIIENNIISNNKLSLLILDEPTDGFSEGQVSKLGNILKNLNLKQIILVSHDEKIEAISDNVLRIEKVNHKSCLI